MSRNNNMPDLDYHAGAVVGTSFQHPTFTIDLAEMTGEADITPVACSLDGLVWYCEAQGGARKSVVVIDRDNLAAVEKIDLQNSDVFVQRGLDWLMTSESFISSSRQANSAYFIPIKRNKEREWIYSNGMSIPDDYGVFTEFEYVKDTEWLFTDASRAGGSTPYAERLNPALGGWQITHGFLIPRSDKENTGQLNNPGISETRWSATAIPYMPLEAGYFRYENENRTFIDTPLSTKFPSWFIRNYHACYENKENRYAVFVVDDTVYVRTMNFLGTGKFTTHRHHVLNQSSIIPASYYLLNMHDFNVWRKNYPELDWNNLAVGKIGDCVVAFECDEGSIDPKEQCGMRLSPTGRYIPLSRKVSWEEDSDGTNASLVPQVQTFREGEEEALMLSLSCERITGTRAYAYNGTLFKVCELNADGTKRAGLELAGANVHIMQGGDMSGGIADAVASRSGDFTYVTDVRIEDTPAPLHRVAGLGDKTVVRSYETQETANDPVIKRESLSAVKADGSRISFTEITHSAREKAATQKTAAEIWNENRLEPFTWQLLKMEDTAVGSGINTNYMLYYKFPMLINYRSDLGVSVGWINPDTGDVEFQEIGRSGCVCNVRATLKDDMTGMTVTAKYWPENGEPHYENISYPSYLDGWMGGWDLTVHGGTTWSSALTATRPCSYSGTNNPDWRASYKHGPALEVGDHANLPFVAVPIRSSMMNVNPPIYPANGLKWMDRFYLSFPAYDMFGEVGDVWMSFYDNMICAQMKQDMRLWSISLQAFLRRTAPHSVYPWSLPDSPDNFNASSVSMAHYVKDPFLYRSDIESFRHKQQLFVNHWKTGELCSKNYPDSNGKAGGNPRYWTHDRYMALKVDIDEDKYKQATSGYKLEHELGSGF